MKQDYAKPLNSRMEGNALTAIGYLLREFCKYLLAAILIIALSIDWESIGL